MEGSAPTTSSVSDFNCHPRTSPQSQFASSGLLGTVDPSFRALSGRPNFTVRRHKSDKDSLPQQHTSVAIRVSPQLPPPHHFSIAIRISPQSQSASQLSRNRIHPPVAIQVLLPLPHHNSVAVATAPKCVFLEAQRRFHDIKQGAQVMKKREKKCRKFDEHSNRQIPFI